MPCNEGPACLHNVGEAKGDNLGHAQLQAAIEGQVEVNMHHLGRVQIQQDVVQVPVSKPQNIANLHAPQVDDWRPSKDLGAAQA